MTSRCIDFGTRNMARGQLGDKSFCSYLGNGDSKTTILLLRKELRNHGFCHLLEDVHFTSKS